MDVRVCEVRPGASTAIRFFRKSDHEWSAVLASPAVTESLGMAIGRHLHGGEAVMLIGDLGAGKTVLVRGLAQACGISREAVNSPTFTLVQEYDGTLHLVHADLFRVEKADDIMDLGWADLFDGTGVVVVEWADRLPIAQLPPDHLTIRMKHRGRQSRLITLGATGPVSMELCRQVIRNFQGADRNAQPS